MPLELYQGRPGFQFPYEGPTQPAEELPEDWEAWGLQARLEHRLARFGPAEAVLGPVS